MTFGDCSEDEEEKNCENYPKKNLKGIFDILKH